MAVSSYTLSITFLFVAFLSSLLIQAQAQPGFISIDCGTSADVNYNDYTGINYISDASFINTGRIESIASEFTSYYRALSTVRSFPEGKRNCYKINITRGSKYLIRTIFLYGNYDGRNTLPMFDLLLGANRWDTVTIRNASREQYNEIIYVPTLAYVQICLANTGTSTPFISAIELRTLEKNTYVTENGPLEPYHFSRCDLGSTKTYRYKDDVYDRYWYPCDFQQNWTSVQNASITDNTLHQSDCHPPAIVMSTAVTPANVSAPLVLSWMTENENDKYYVYMHFTEIQVLAANQTREFNIFLNGNPRPKTFSPQYMNVSTLYSESAISGKEITYLLEMTENSTLPPIISATEIYRVKDFQHSDTFQGDVDAITTIKSVYVLTKDWQGDPCFPEDYLWDGLNCTYRDDSPRITTLNLSSSGLSGKIHPSISKLTMLEKLDLSNNNLDDEIPDFLSQLQQLKILNLENNNLSGAIPSALVEKYKEGSLLLSVGQNPNLCAYGQCNDKKKKKTNIITPLIALISGVLILLMIVTILWALKRRKPKVEKLTALMVEMGENQISRQYTEQDDALRQPKKQIYSYSDVLKITNNFNTIIGKGGFGTVYLGYIGATPVAVKMLSPSSVRGYQQFQAEVKLLMRVHHKNLTSLIGYCDEGTNKSLMYEYMANGNLQENLYGKDNKLNILSWEDRLRISLDAASGLEYLHTGCKPPIIHRDVKSTNILLNEHFQAKLSDFGLSKIFPTDGGSHVSTVVAGTPGYLDPHYYISNRLTEKSDVYGYGVVLLEIITGQPVKARNRGNIHMVEWVSSLVEKGDIKGIVDSTLEGEFDINSAWKAVETAMACVSLDPIERPMMSVIVVELKEALATELARTKDNTTSGANSVEPVNMNLDTELAPLAR
ncbi:hypothetical protein Fmac_019897 [Flemingia macrophylla]|uniref:non-specific serine/threonine protein kinase n=1 Tax=Flemingia macrophylla TaxID=520843 RepID=A0ABD1M945_9FABA